MDDCFWKNPSQLLNCSFDVSNPNRALTTISQLVLLAALILGITDTIKPVYLIFFVILFFSLSFFFYYLYQRMSNSGNIKEHYHTPLLLAEDPHSLRLHQSRSWTLKTGSQLPRTLHPPVIPTAASSEAWRKPYVKPYQINELGRGFSVHYGDEENRDYISREHYPYYLHREYYENKYPSQKEKYMGQVLKDTRHDVNDPFVPDLRLPSSLQEPGYDPRFNYSDKLHWNTTVSDPEQAYFSAHNIIEPINALNGISYIPESYSDGNRSHLNYMSVSGHPDAIPNFMRPEAIRDETSKNRREEQPVRGDNSSKFPLEGEYGSIPIEEIYDPRFNGGIGDSARSYYDLEAGRVKYFYRNIDTYRYPTFITRSNVDHIDAYQPSGEIWANKERDVGLNAYKDLVEDRFHQDELQFREEIMERKLRRDNRRRWQLRVAPVHQGPTMQHYPRER